MSCPVTSLTSVCFAVSPIPRAPARGGARSLPERFSGRSIREALMKPASSSWPRFTFRKCERIIGSQRT
jgi:hypothetical protein